MTGKEILEQEFEKAGMRGYRSDDVDSFLQSMAAFVDKQSAQIKELTYKIQILADKIEEYKKDEENIRDALLGAQKMGASILNEAKSKAETLTRDAKVTSEELTEKSQEQAERVLREAKMASEEMLSQAKVKIENLTKESLVKANNEIASLKKATETEQSKLEKMKQEVSAFRSSILKQYKAHLDLLTNLPSVEEDSPKAKESVVENIERTAKAPKVEKAEPKPQEPKFSTIEIQKPEVFEVHPQTVTSEILPAASAEELAQEEKQQTKEYKHKIVGVSEENENEQNDFVAHSSRPSFVAKFGELDFGNYNKDK